MSTLVVILIFLAAVLLVYGVWVFNRLISLRTRADNAWSDIDVQLKRRWDLVPRLVETVGGYARHEASTLQETAAARGRALEARSVSDRSRAESELARGTVQLVALAEGYPDLKADEMFRSLHDNLVEVEDTLQSARRYYNAVVRDLNTAMKVFPASLVARGLGFAPCEFFELDGPQQAAVPAVSLEKG
ncbi:MAG: LemA family protein [Planctomycetota bacterium]